MEHHSVRMLPLIDAGQPGHACCAPSAHEQPDAQPAAAATPAGPSFLVEGMTCGHCASRVTKMLSALPGVTGVRISLVPGASSTVTLTAGRPVPEAGVRTAIEEAGYRVADS